MMRLLPARRSLSTDSGRDARDTMNRSGLRERAVRVM